MSAHQATFAIPPSPDSTISIEVKKTGIFKRKYFLVFPRYSGRLLYNEDDPLASVLQLNVQTETVSCWEADRKTQGREMPRHALDLQALSARIRGEISFLSERFTSKPLRGYVTEGTLTMAGLARNIKANIGFGPVKNNRLQIDADARLRLSDFNIQPQSSSMGLARLEDEIFLQVLVWGDLVAAPIANV